MDTGLRMVIPGLQMSSLMSYGDFSAYTRAIK
jgi:hypothetical protein